jgi:hypothetical protein
MHPLSIRISAKPVLSGNPFFLPFKRDQEREEVIKAIEEIGSGGKNLECYRVNR